ncbi:glycoside hydrolase family 3 C-terminal domain-containing protein [Actinoplanes sp. CA-142083]|uniref:glycoside hydrolase family 3 C-terminal domain-containing protein n=1 Tax=Actinoplanes sp. CA-142083 TaxID=3239903 RepID=UPI003D8ECD95
MQGRSDRAEQRGPAAQRPGPDPQGLGRRRPARRRVLPELVVQLVTEGRVSEERIDVSARRILRDKFRLGLFDTRRYVDPAAAATIAGSPSFVAAGLSAQRKSIVVLADRPSGADTPTLPLAEGIAVYLDGVDPAVAARYAKVVATPDEAEAAIVRRSAPYEKRTHGFESFFHAGRLDFPADELSPLALSGKLPTVVDVLLDRPAVLTPLAERVAALTGSFGAGDEALLDILFGKFPSSGTLPFELPSSMAEVEAAREDVPNDTATPLYPYAHGLSI